jgi:uncharacterized protein YfeS
VCDDDLDLHHIIVAADLCHAVEASGQVTDKAKEAGLEALDRGKSVGQEAVSVAADTAQESDQQQAADMTVSLHGKAQEVGQSY